MEKCYVIYRKVRQWFTGKLKGLYGKLNFSPESRIMAKGGKAPGKKVWGSDLLWNVENFLQERYEFRYNRLSESTEFCPKPGNRIFQTVGQREMNSLCIDARKSGIDCWDRDISRFIHSAHIPSYHPFELYMEGLPQWDGVDRVGDIALRVSDKPVWTEGFHRWMLALVAQWMCMDSSYGNSVAPVLVSRRQGKHKSTFCRMLLPEELQRYYTDSFDLTSVSGCEQKLAMLGLINLDELDKFSVRKMAQLKNLMQMAGLNIRKAYKKNYSALPRIASFIATSNQKELLTDPTGSRRFLCVEVDKQIDCSPIDHTQLYAQLKAELENGTRYWFTSEEEAKIMENNAPFQKRGMEQDVFFSFFRKAENREEGRLYSAAWIFSYLKKKNPAAMRDISTTEFSRLLTALDIDKIHTTQGNRYRVVPLLNAD